MFISTPESKNWFTLEMYKIYFPVVGIFLCLQVWLVLNVVTSIYNPPCKYLQVVVSPVSGHGGLVNPLSRNAVDKYLAWSERAPASPCICANTTRGSVTGPGQREDWCDNGPLQLQGGGWGWHIIELCNIIVSSWVKKRSRKLGWCNIVRYETHFRNICNILSLLSYLLTLLN